MPKEYESGDKVKYSGRIGKVVKVNGNEALVESGGQKEWVSYHDLKRADDADEDHNMTDKAKEDAARKDSEEKEKADKAKRDADAGHTLDVTLSHQLMDSIKAVADAVAGLGKRMDAYETNLPNPFMTEEEKKEKEKKKKKSSAKKDEDEDEEKAKEDAEEGEDDPEKMAADKAKKDAEEEKEREDKAKKDKAREDKAKADSASLSSRIEEVARMIPKDVNDQDYHALVDAQSRADEVFGDFNMRAPRPQQGEDVALYERRCVRMLKDHSPTWKASDTSKLDDASFQVVKNQVYREAKESARNPVNLASGALREVKRERDGHTIIDFYGAPRAWMDHFAGPVQLRGEGVFKHQNLGQ